MMKAKKSKAMNSDQEDGDMNQNFTRFMTMNTFMASKTCKIMNFDERVKFIAVNRNSSDFGYFAAISNTKFTLYYAYIDTEEDPNEEVGEESPEEADDDGTGLKRPKLTIACDKQWEVNFSSI